jgi:SAM-dependent methyltransferase
MMSYGDPEYMTTEISSCEICGGTSLFPVLDLGPHPLCDDLVPVGQQRVCPEFPIEILFCDRCQTAHQRFQVAKQLLFPATYHYRARFTADVLNGMAGLVSSCEERLGPLSGKRVLDIGCNDGSLLNFFKGRNATTIGVEPTGASIDAENNGHHIFNEFWTQTIAEQIKTLYGAPDIITFTNVFAHISNLRDVLTALKFVMDSHTILIIENHYLGSILALNQFDTFYHEHPRSYSFRSFQNIAQLLDLALLDAEFPSRYGGNIRVFIGDPSAAGLATSRATEPVIEEEFLEKFNNLSGCIARWRSSKRAAIEALVREHGPLRAKAFPGRAAILIKLLALEESVIPVVYEKPGSMKIGHYLPGTRIEIRSDDELFQCPDLTKPIVNLAWHIPAEIRGYLAERGYTGPVVDILSLADFA